MNAPSLNKEWKIVRDERHVQCHERTKHALGVLEFCSAIRKPSKRELEKLPASPEAFRIWYSGEAGCDTKDLWRELLQKWDASGVHLPTIKIEEFEFVHEAWHYPSCDISEETAEKCNLELEKIFNGLVEKWKSETGSWSSISRRYAHPAYQAILVLGKDALPLIFQSLKKEPDYWFAALRALIPDNPVSRDASFDQAVDAWLRFGKDEGYLD